MEKRKMGNSPERVYQSARYAIILLVILTALNILMSVLNIDRYFVSSVFLSYFMVTLIESKAVGVVVAALILVPYLLSFFLSKKKPAWMVVALVLFILDTLFVIYFAFLLYRIGESPLSMLLDLLMHAFVIFELVMGVKYRKEATAEPEETAEGPVMRSDDNGTYQEVACIAAFSKENGKHTAEAGGVVRFYENEMAVGTVNTAQAMLVGSAYSSPTERMRFAYSEIARVFYAKKNERTIQIDLADGRYVYFMFGTVANASRDQLTEQLYAHGFTVEPFAG